MPKSAYLHIPFCIKKCAYCSFLSGENPALTGVYTNALIKEIKKFYTGGALETIYLGGGTPSLLSPNELEEILSELKFSADSEITLEVNPKTVDLEKLKAFKSLGVNRISLGVQAFDDRLLKIIERAHSVKDALETIDNIEHAGFENFSIDLMYGLPSQSLKDWQKTLQIALSTGAKHISLYGLKIEEGCEFFSNPPKDLPDEDMQADMYEEALCTLNNWEHYEFSNFARSSEYKSRHNSVYWRLEPYFGFGLGASGFINNMRYQNECNMDNYLKDPAFYKDFEPYDEKKRLEESIFLGFRLLEGIDVERTNKKFNIDFDKKYAAQLKKFLASGHIQKTLHGYCLTKEGIMLSNSVLIEFIDDKS